MGICNNCKKIGVIDKERKNEMQVAPISTCDSCHMRYWTESGELENKPVN